MAEDKDLETFARLLKRRRKELAISQREAGERCEVSETAIAMFETKRRRPTPEVLLRLVQGLDLPLEEVIALVPPSMRHLLERTSGRHLLQPTTDISDLGKAEQQRLADLFLREFPRVPLLKRLCLGDLERDGALRREVLESEACAYLYGAHVPWTGAFFVDLDALDPDSPLEGCHRVLCAPNLPLPPGGLGLVVRPHRLSLRRVHPCGEYLVLEARHSREVVLEETFLAWVDERSAQMLTVVETMVRQLDPPRSSLFR
jgi:transcriptional regulator with XRE-family HTH domain